MAAHPALKFWGLAKLFLIFAFGLAIYATAAPAWSRIKTATAISATVPHLKYASTSVTEESTLYYGLWQWCLDYGDSDDGYTCGDTRPSKVPAFGRDKCKGHLLGAQILAVATVVFIFLALLAASAVAKGLASWNPALFFKAPSAAAAAALLFTLLGLGCAIGAWACWFVLGETNCRHSEGNIPWSPFQGYSSSFICMCIASGMALLASLLMCLGFTKLNKVPAPLEVPKEEYEVVQASYPVEYVEAVTHYPTTMTTPVY